MELTLALHNSFNILKTGLIPDKWLFKHIIGSHVLPATHMVPDIAAFAFQGKTVEHYR